MTNRSPITTHVLDTTTGLPGAGIAITLSQLVDDQWHIVADGITDEDGRINDLLATDYALETSQYKMHFAIAPYLKKQARDIFYPFVDIVFNANSDAAHYHIPLLLSSYSYSTYRGS